MKKIKIVLIYLILILIMIAKPVLADPNSSKGFLNYDEEMQQEEVEQIEQATQQITEPMEVLSSNNFLENLEVSGIELSPSFDKQILDYTINAKNKKQINISAKVSDPNATIEGIGNIDITGKDEIRIEVTAQNGSVRTYLLHLKEEEQTQPTSIEEDTKIINNLQQEEQKEEINIELKQLIAIGACIAIVILIIILSKPKKKKKKSKRAK